MTSLILNAQGQRHGGGGVMGTLVLHPAAVELANDCASNGAPAAAAIIRAGLTGLAADAAADVTALARQRWVGEVLAAQVRAWGAGRLDAVAASNVAWERCGCTDCAKVALERGSAARGWCWDRIAREVEA